MSTARGKEVGQTCNFREEQEEALLSDYTRYNVIVTEWKTKDNLL